MPVCHNGGVLVPDSTGEQLDLKRVRALVDIQDGDDRVRLCLTVAGDVLVIEEASPTILGRLPDLEEPVEFVPAANGQPAAFIIGVTTFSVAPGFPANKLQYAAKCFSERNSRDPGSAPKPSSAGWYPDPTLRFSERYFNSRGSWEWRCRDENGHEFQDRDSDLAAFNACAVPPSPDIPATPTSAIRPSKAPQVFSPGVDIIGANGSIRVDGSFVVLNRGLAHDLVLGNLRGSKSIPIKSIQAVQLKRATRFVTGALEFVVTGDRSNTGNDRMSVTGESNQFVNLLFGRQVARLANENIIAFTAAQESAFIELHAYVLEQIDKPQLMTLASPALPTAQSTDLVAQLERLRALHTEGVLTDGEFAAAKARLLA